ncbi:hypothetical protein IWZ01DRAFT_165119 [Phyllosticta capitalensis]
MLHASLPAESASTAIHIHTSFYYLFAFASSVTAFRSTDNLQPFFLHSTPYYYNMRISCTVFYRLVSIFSFWFTKWALPTTGRRCFNCDYV